MSVNYKKFHLSFPILKGEGARVPVEFFFNGSDEEKFNEFHDLVKAHGDFQDASEQELEFWADARPVVAAAMRNEELVLVDRLPEDIQAQIRAFIAENGTGF